MKTKNLCPLCGGRMKEDVTTFTVDLKSGVLVVRKVPATVCSQCGESWIRDQAAEVLEKMVAEFRKRMVQVEVVEFSQVA